MQSITINRTQDALTLTIPNELLNNYVVADIIRNLKINGYDFIDVTDEKEISLEEIINKELILRYNMFLNDSTGKDWEILKKELI